jgi:dienelactone hydrolase
MMNLKFAGILFVTLIIVWLQPIASAAAWRGEELPAPTGTYAVGTIEYPMMGGDRPGNYADGSSTQHRELMAQLWYPAVPTGNVDKSIYLDEMTMEYFLKKSAPDGLSVNSRFLVGTHAFYGAPAVEMAAPFPVVIFSPGLGTTYFFYQSILEDMASHGYVVIAVNSPDIAGIAGIPGSRPHSIGLSDADSDMMVETYLNVHFQDTVADLRFTARQLRALNDDVRLPLTGRLDVQKIACFGHSYGGAAAVEAADDDEMICAGADIDGSFYGSAYRQPRSKPMLLLANAVSCEKDPTMQDFCKTHGADDFIVKVGEAVHMGFSDFMLLQASYSGQDTAKTTARKYIQLTRDSLLAFFDMTLKHVPDSLEAVALKYPGIVTVEPSADIYGTKNKL